MWRSSVLLAAVLAGCSLFSGVISQSVNNCTATVQITGAQSDPNGLAIPLGIVCFQCVVNGAVVTGTTTFLQGGLIPADQAMAFEGTLVVFDTNVTFSASPAKVLRCSNGPEARDASVSLDVYLPPIISGSITVNEGDDLNLLCNAANSNGAPVTSWFNQSDGFISIDLLNIPNIMRSQAGNYTCETRPPNPDNSTSATATVVVQFAPDVTADAVGLVDVPVGIGTLMISCSYLGIPPPLNVNWARDDITLDPDADSRVTVEFDDTRTTLTITEVMENEGGTYRCVPTNIVGSNSATTQVRIQLPPGPPTGLAVVPNSETVNSLTISWTNPDSDGFSPIAGFTVNLTSRHPDDIIRSIPGDATTMMATLNSLPPFTEYTIQLSVRNAVELEGEPAVIMGMTDSFILDRVMNLMASVVNSTAINVTWMEPNINSNTTDAVDMYQITLVAPSTETSETRTVPSTETSILLSGLEMGTQYDITVFGVNSAGPGMLDSRSVSTNIDPPSVPQNFNGTSIDPFTISVSWEQPATDGGRPIVRYDLTLTNVGSGVVSSEVIQPTSTLEITFSGLEQDTAYRLAITAVNRDGDEGGDERVSEVVEITVTTMAVGLPKIPDASTISASGITNTSATVSWNNPGGFPDSYTLQVKPTNLDWTSPGVITMPDISALSTGTTRHMSVSRDIAGLMPLTTHDARVLSINFNGASNYSEEARFSTVGMVMIGGGEGAVNATLETTSGDTVTLTCSLDQLGNDTLTFTWSRQGGRALPHGSDTNNGVLTIPGASVEDSGVYVCTASGVQGTFTLSVMEQESGSQPVSTTVIIIVVVVVIVALLAFLFAVVIAVYCLCFRDSGKTGSSPHRRTFSFRSKHWTDASGSHSMPREQQSRKELVQSFHMPDDYTTTTSFDTTDRVRRSPSPPSHSKNTHAGAEPTTSFQLQSDNTVL